MGTAHLVVDAETLVWRAHGPATGAIFLRAAPHAFPAEGWDDFVVVILDAWLEALLGLLSSTTGAVQEVWFMEGPYAVRLQRTSASDMDLACVERDQDIVLTASAPILAFARGALDGAETILAALPPEAAPSNRDAARLREHVIRLKTRLIQPST